MSRARGSLSIHLRIFRLVCLLHISSSRRHCANKPDELQKMMATNYSFGIERNEEALKRNDFDHRKWTNPLEHRYASHIYGQIVPHPTHVPDYPMLLL